MLGAIKAPKAYLGDKSMFYIPSYIIEQQMGTELIIKSALLGNEISLTEQIYIDEYKKLKLLGTNEIKTKLEVFLYEQEMLCEDEVIENINKQILELLEKKMLLTIMPTESCNFRCPYCYEEHQNIHMTSEIVDGIKKYIEKQIDTTNILSISWFGGEPTLRVDIIEEISKHILKLIETKSVTCEYVASMTTNGYLLTKELFEKLWKYQIKEYQITLDGFEHNKTRPLKNGSPTLQTILDNLLEISHLPQEYDFSIMLRRNIKQGDTTDWYDYLNKLFGKDKRFSLMVRAVSDWGGETVHKMELLKEDEKDSLLEEHNNYIKNLAMLSADNKIDGKWNPFDKLCYAAYPKGFVFRANGNIEKCTIILGHEKNVVGNVQKDGNIIIDNEKNRVWSNLLNYEKCLSCKNMSQCNDMRCPQGNVLNGKSYFCENKRT